MISPFAYEGIESEASGATPSIWREIDSLNFEYDVLTKAKEIYERMDVAVHRGNHRRRLLFYCVYSAMLELDRARDPREVALRVGIKPRDITRAFAAFTEHATGYQPPLVLVSPIKLACGYADQLGLPQDTIERIQTFAAGVVDANPDFLESKPQKVAVGILLYFLRTFEGLDWTARQFAQQFGLSEVTIGVIYRKVATIDNAA